MNDKSLQSVMQEERSFPPPARFAATAHPNAAELALLREQAGRDSQEFWAEQARRELVWHKPFTRTLDDLYLRLDTVRDLPLRGAATLPDRLARHREAAYLARELTRIRCDMPLAVSRADLRRRVPDMPGIDGFCSANGFGQLLSRQAARLCG